MTISTKTYKCNLITLPILRGEYVPFWNLWFHGLDLHGRMVRVWRCQGHTQFVEVEEIDETIQPDTRSAFRWTRGRKVGLTRFSVGLIGGLWEAMQEETS